MKIFVAIFLLSICSLGYAQVDSTRTILKKKISNAAAKPKPVVINDTITKATDSTILLKDSTFIDSAKSVRKDSFPIDLKDTTIYKLLLDFPILNNDEPAVMITAFRNNESKDFVFYLLIGIVLFLAIIKTFFAKYFKNTFDVFFQASFRQKQTREQLTQDNVAALLLNILFILSTANFVALIAKKFKVITISFWQVFAVAVIALTIIYVGKFLFTKFIGWIFNKKEEATSYSFLVFIVNKMVGVVLIPFLFLLAFSTPRIESIAFTISILIIILLLLFRFFSTYKNMSGRLNINAIHFFLYFCTIEILPLLLMYKALSNYIGNGI